MPSNFAGIDFSPLPTLIAPFNFSTSIPTVAIPAIPGVWTQTNVIAGANGANYITTPEGQAFTGWYLEVFGGQLFERVLVEPRTAALGFVITDTQFTATAWNTFRNIGQTLTSIAVSGSGDLTVSNPYGLPTYYAALGDLPYQVTVPRTGAPNINTQICWNYASGIGGTCIKVTGNRIVLFSAPVDWDYGTKETIEYFTDVLAAYSDAEQRRALRQLARRGASFRAKGLTARDAAGIESLVWGWQSQPYGVPWWPDVSPLLADAAAGSLTLQVDTTDRQFVAGGIAAIWRDEFTFEALAISAVASGSITLSNPTQLAWTAGKTTLIMPVFLGRLPDSIDVTRLFSGADEIEIDFAGESGQAAPAPTISLTQYKGFDVLEVPAQWPKNLNRRYDRSLIHIDPKVGPITVIDKGGSPVASQPFPWLLLNHAQVTTLRAFVLKRFGRFAPFWIPTWDQDLVLVQNVALNDTGLKVKSEFYTRFMFPSQARRYVALIPMDGSGNMYRQIVSSVDNGDGTETLAFDTLSSKAFGATTTMVSFLIFARLDRDLVTLQWLNNDLAQTELEMRELPHEVPT